MGQAKWLFVCSKGEGVRLLGLSSGFPKKSGNVPGCVIGYSCAFLRNYALSRKLMSEHIQEICLLHMMFRVHGPNERKFSEKASK